MVEVRFLPFHYWSLSLSLSLSLSFSRSWLWLLSFFLFPSGGFPPLFLKWEEEEEEEEEEEKRQLLFSLLFSISPHWRSD